MTEFNMIRYHGSGEENCEGVEIDEIIGISR